MLTYKGYDAMLMVQRITQQRKDFSILVILILLIGFGWILGLGIILAILYYLKAPYITEEMCGRCYGKMRVVYWGKEKWWYCYHCKEYEGDW